MPKPTKAREWLEPRFGTWEATVSCPMMGEPTRATETARAFGDFSVVADFSGQRLGQGFTGLSVMTYDPVRRKYVSTWCDTRYPGIAVFEGTLDATGKKLTSTGKAPSMEGALVDFTSVLEVKGPDEAAFTMYETAKGASDASAMRIDYRRRKQLPGKPGAALRPPERTRPAAPCSGAPERSVVVERTVADFTTR